MSGVHGLMQEAYVSCVSGFPYMVYINSNRRVTACLVATIKSLRTGMLVYVGIMNLLYYNQLHCNS
jgi:hypothetical protein